MIKPLWIFALCLGVLYTSTVAAASSDTQPAAVKLNSSDTLQGNLGRYVGSKVELVLVSGKSLAGTVKAVGSSSVHLTALEGRDFYDALVRHDQIGSIVIRAR